MPTVRFTRNIQRHVECPTEEVAGATLATALESYFGSHGPARGYVLDDCGRLRHHMAAFIDGRQIEDRDRLERSSRRRRRHRHRTSPVGRLGQPPKVPMHRGSRRRRQMAQMRR